MPHVTSTVALVGKIFGRKRKSSGINLATQQKRLNSWTLGAPYPENAKGYRNLDFLRFKAQNGNPKFGSGTPSKRPANPIILKINEQSPLREKTSGSSIGSPVSSGRSFSPFRTSALRVGEKNNPSGSGSASEPVQIAGMQIPKWMLYVAGVIAAAIGYLFLKPKKRRRR